MNVWDRGWAMTYVLVVVFPMSSNLPSCPTDARERKFAPQSGAVRSFGVGDQFDAPFWAALSARFLSTTTMPLYDAHRL